MLMPTGTSCHFCHLLQVSKKISLKSDFRHCFFYDFIHVLMATEMSCHLFICCKFKKMSLKPDFIHCFHDLIHVYSPGAGADSPQGTILMSTERPYHFTHLLQVSKKSLWSLILQFFHDLIYVYSPGAGGIQPPGDIVLISTGTFCHFGHLLLVSNHWRLQFLKNPLFYLFPIQKHKGPNLTLS